MNDETQITLQGTTNSDAQTERVYKFESPGVIKGALVGTEIGQEYALQNYAFLVRDGTKTNLWTSLDKKFLAANGRDYNLDMRYEFDKGDELILRAENHNQDGHQYHHSMLIDVDYETSITERIKDALRGTL